MKKRVSSVLDKEDEKIVHLFTALGMPRNLSKTLLYVCQVDECRSADIEQGADLRQPEVSIAMQEFRRKGWVKKRDLKKKGKGRPVHVYTTTTDLSSILHAFEQEKLKEVDRIKKDFSELKDIIQSR